jgi:hypothetical protein
MFKCLAVDWSPETLLQTFKFEHGYTCNSRMARLLTEVLSNLPLGEFCVVFLVLFPLVNRLVDCDLDSYWSCRILDLCVSFLE